MTDLPPNAIRQDNWFVLLDPDWRPSTPEDQPLAEVIVGGWQLDEDGRLGPFEPNPVYMPLSESTPTDPVDALLRLIARGQRDIMEQLLSRLRDTVVEIGCGADDEMLIGSAPDGVMCVPVVTASVHKDMVEADQWIPVLGSTLPEIIPPGIDVLINPGSSTQFRLITTALKLDF